MGKFSLCCSGGSDGPPSGHCRGAFGFAGRALVGLGAVIAVALVFGWVVMTAWNAVIPDTFHLSVLTYWQAVALLVLGRVLTGRFRHGSCTWKHGPGARFRHASFRQWWQEEGETAYRTFRDKTPD